MKDQKPKLSRRTRLVRFAHFVLETMQADKEWSADTLSVIGETAINLRLADTDAKGNFRQNVR